MAWPWPAFKISFRGGVSAAALALLAVAPLHAGESAISVTETARPGDFPLVNHGQAAPLCADPEDFPVVHIAATNFQADVRRVTGVAPAGPAASPTGDNVVFIGTLGHSRVIDALVAAGKIDPAPVRGQWESFEITTVADPAPGVKSGLVIAGSDRRGTAFGVFALSEAIGVSPWYWWADVPPQTHRELFIPAGVRVQGPPAVKFRGIFINDEDWGMKPWAAQTDDPATHDIGPRTYAKICELLLRLRANYLWPAMHGCTRAFDTFPENRVVADTYAIVMGSSHCEPMLRNNVGEWPRHRAAAWNYQTNADEVLRYWEQRVRENGRYENVYTLGMRGVHDDALHATGTPQEKVALVERIIADQRGLLSQWVKPDVTQIPQVFVPYKEVLTIYRDGLRVPDDVTLMWVDDNHGYIRQLSSPEEQKRAGGSGVYYHVSYWGAPENYLWLCSTPPALIGEEMGKALEQHARTIWMLNVGDLKPAEVDIDCFLRLARTGRVLPQPAFLRDWAERQFGPEHAEEIAAVLDRYYLLNGQVKPEHLLYQTFSQSPENDEATRRLRDYAALAARTDRIYAALPERYRDAFYELAVYPIRCSAAANAKVLCVERSRLLAAKNDSAANDYADRAEAAHALINRETDYYNHQLAGGKWNRMMFNAPASLKLARVPQVARLTNGTPAAVPAAVADDVAPEAGLAPSFAESHGCVAMEAAHFTRNQSRRTVAWQRVAGLGRTGQAMTVAPTTLPSLTNSAVIAGQSPELEYDFTTTSTGAATVTVYCVPVHPVYSGRGARYAVAVDDEPPQIVDIEAAEYSKTWSANVLRAAALGTSRHNLSVAGPHTLKLWMVDPGVPVDKLVVDFGGAGNSFFGPPETRRAGAGRT